MKYKYLSWILVIFSLGELGIVGVNGIPPLQIKSGAMGSITEFEDDLHKVFRVPTDPKFRLPETVFPTKYKIEMVPILEEEATLGELWTAPSRVTITVDCFETTSSIILHSSVKSIDEASVTVIRVANNETLPISSHTYDTEKQFYIISLGTPLLVNEKYEIFIKYIAPVSIDRLDGLYRSHYIDPETGTTKYLAATQFQAYGARSAFPCFDEPNYKAVFEMTLARKSNYSALSSAPLRETTPHETLPNWHYDHFEETVVMSTCIMAILISDYAAARAPEGYFDKPVQTILPKYLVDQGAGDYAAIIAAKDLAFFEEYYIEQYALPKMDSAGIIDFAAGAMENWGLNIYREPYLVYIEGENTEADRRRTGEIIAHELAHQWFGNLVTCKWWIGAWLNEGHASYVQYMGLNHTNPEFESLKALQTDAKQHAMRYDVLENSHPTSLPDKGNPYDTMAYSAPLVYQKGASIIKMMEGFLTISTLQRGYQEYLRDYAFLSTVQDQLFSSLQKVAVEDEAIKINATMKDIMDTYTLWRGYPLVRVIRAGSNRIFVTQEMFKNHDSQWEDPEYLWHIPIAVATESNPNVGNTVPDFWLEKINFVAREHNTSQWILLNSGATGYYRVLYDDVLTGLLQNQLINNHLVIADGSRSQILDDYFTFAFQHYDEIENALEFTMYLGSETEHYVWAPVFFHLRKYYTVTRGTEKFNTFSAYLRPKIGAVLQTIGLEQQPSNRGLVVLFRTQLLDWHCGFGSPDCLNYATGLYDQWKSSPTINPIPQDLRPVLYCAAVREGGIENFNFALSRYQAEIVPRQKSLNLASLGCTSDTELLHSILAMTINSSSIIQRNDASAAFTSVASNSKGAEIVLPFLNSQLDEIISYFQSQTIVSSVISTLSSSLHTEEGLNNVRTFVDANRDKLSDVIPSLNAAINNVESNINWMTNYGDSMNVWFERNR